MRSNASSWIELNLMRSDPDRTEAKSIRIPFKPVSVKSE